MTDDEHPTTPDAAGEGGGAVRHDVPRTPADAPGATDAPRTGVPPAAVPDLTGQAGPPTGPPVRRRHLSRLRWAVWSVALVVVLGLLVSSRITLNYYAIQPGTAQPVQPFITVPASKAHHVVQPVLLTDVEEARVTALNYLYFKLASDTALYSVPAVTGGTAPAELDAQGALEMSQAESAAKVASLRYLGYTVPATPAGAVIAGTFAGTPAYGVLNVGDVITAVDGKPTLSALALTSALAPYQRARR